MRTKLIASAVAFIGVLTMLWIIQAQHKENVELRSERGQLIKVANDSGRIARTYINLFGQEVSKNHVLDLSLRNARDMRNSQELAFLKQFEGVNKKLNNVELALKIQAGVIINLKLKNDSVPQFKWPAAINSDSTARFFSYGDPSSKDPALKYNLINGVSVADSTFLEGESQAPLDGAMYWHRKHHFIFKKWQFGKKEWDSELTCANPWVKLTNHEFIRVLKKR